MPQEKTKASGNCACGCGGCGGGKATQFARQAIRVEGTGRLETMQGRQYRVFPAVLVRSQVLKNNLGRSYLPASEITEEWADQWNGIPVLIGMHPNMGGEDVSGRSPALWNERQVGFIFNAKVDTITHDQARLVGEVWLDETRLDAVVGYKAVLDQVGSGKAVELSTGFRTHTDYTAGRFGTDDYDLIMRPVAPDHLVISTEFTGACSVQDGCGLGINEQVEQKPQGGENKSRSKNSANKNLWDKLVALFESQETQEETQEKTPDTQVQVQGESADLAEVAAATNNTVPATGEESNMSDQNKDLAAQVEKLTTAVQALAAEVEGFKAAAKQDPHPAIAGLKQQLAKLTDEFIASRDVTAAAVNERERERQGLIRKLVGHVRVPFTAADLEAKPLNELRMLEQMAEGTNFSGRGGPQGGNGADEQRYAEPISPWQKREE